MITAQIESYTKCIEDIKPLYHDHWLELAMDQDRVPLDPQYETYLHLDTAGNILLATLREEGELAGYLIGLIAPGMHYKTCLVMTLDIFRVLPEYRNRELGGVKLFRCAEEEARRLGVKRMVYSSKVKQDASKLFEFLGCEKIETVYSKWIGD